MTMLIIISKLINELNSKKIKYVHWKSNEHLNEALNGETDLDLLVDEEDYFSFLEVMNKLEFKKFKTQPFFDYHSVDDYLGFDENTGKLIHLHVHFKLVIGKKFVKETHLPFEKKIFETSIIDEYSNLKIINPNLEIILLIIRFISKHQGLLYRPQNLNNEYIKEYVWLKNRVELKELELFFKYIFQNVPYKFNTKLLMNMENKNNLKSLKKYSKTFLKNYRKSSLFSVAFLYYYSNIRVALKNIIIKRGKLPYPYKRVHPVTGKIIVFMGVDGSGKSTLLSYTKKWLSKKMDIYPVYFGAGKGSTSLLRFPFYITKKIFSVSKSKDNNGKTRSNDVNKDKGKKNSNLVKSVKIIHAIILANEKKKKFKKIAKAKRNGLIVISDRFPQNEISGYNDGPKLQHWLNNDNTLKNKIATWEHNIYNMGEKISPDVIIKLEVNKETAKKRKPETPTSMIIKKINAVNKIQISKSASIKKVNTQNSFEITKKEIRNIIKSFI